MTVSSLLIFMIVLFLALAIFLGTPIAVALGLAAVAELILQGEVPLMIAAQRIFNGVNSVTLMGIPFFMLVGPSWNAAASLRSLSTLPILSSVGCAEGCAMLAFSLVF